MSDWERFPTDEVSLTMLAAACEINPDTGHTELGRFLEMTGGPVTSVTNEATGDIFSSLDEAVEAWDEEEPPVFYVEHDKPPHSEHTVIISLIEEIRRLSDALALRDGKVVVRGRVRDVPNTEREPS